MKKITCTFIGIVFSLSSFSQLTYITEQQVSYDILHWHYDRYNNSETSEWYKYSIDGDEYYGVKFSHEGTPYQSIYNSEGMIISEKRIMDEKELPDEITDVLDYRLVKYKVKEFVIETEFENRQEKNKHYKVDARTKTGGQVILWFDSQMNVVPERNNQLAIR